MEKVVKTGLKFDLHIHSVVSAHKDGIKVKNNTLENIGVLIERLNDNKVNLCSITDHDNFSYEMYRGLKAAESMDNSILRVLNSLIGETPSDFKKKIPLFDLPACAGDGFYFDQNNVPSEMIEVDKQDADYAVKISGKSMEPTIKDGSVVMVKQVDVLSNGDIGIFIINGEVMCKRYIIDESGIILKPDNQSCNYSNIAVSETDWVVQGKVIYW